MWSWEKSKTGTKLPAAARGNARCRLLDRRSTKRKKRKGFPTNRPAVVVEGKQLIGWKINIKVCMNLFFMHRPSVRLPASRTSIILWCCFFRLSAQLLSSHGTINFKVLVIFAGWKRQRGINGENLCLNEWRNARSIIHNVERNCYRVVWFNGAAKFAWRYKNE